MRVLLVGRASDRARVRSELEARSMAIIGEFPTLAAARASMLDIDAIIVLSAHDDERSLVIREDAVDDNVFDEPLTPREAEALNLLAEGLPNKAIAGRLGISDQTVKFHVSSICGKLGAVNRTEAVRRAMRRGLITL